MAYKSDRPTQQTGAAYKEEPRHEQKEAVLRTEHRPTQMLAVAVVALLLAVGGRGRRRQSTERMGVHKQQLITIRRAAYRKAGGAQKDRRTIWGVGPHKWLAYKWGVRCWWPTYKRGWQLANMCAGYTML